MDEIVEVDGVAAGLCVRFGDDGVQVRRQAVEHRSGRTCGRRPPAENRLRR
jgi:hypothetical protein